MKSAIIVWTVCLMGLSGCDAKTDEPSEPMPKVGAVGASPCDQASDCGVPKKAVSVPLGAQVDLERALRDGMGGTGVAVVRDGDDLRLVMPGDIVFRTNSADIRADFFPVLNAIAKLLVTHNDNSLRISGHTDSTGSDSINQPLSQRRADSVAMYLRSQKVGSARIESYGYGSRFPAAHNDTAAGREQNRRVEIEIVPMGS